MKCLLTYKISIGCHSPLFPHRAVNGCFICKDSEFIPRFIVPEIVSSLEWIANGQVETIAIIEAQQIVKALLSRMVRNMKADTPIHTNDEQA